jgi:hypothetical protein
MSDAEFWAEEAQFKADWSGPVNKAAWAQAQALAKSGGEVPGITKGLITPKVLGNLKKLGYKPAEVLYDLLNEKNSRYRQGAAELWATSTRRREKGENTLYDSDSVQHGPRSRE